MFIFIAALWLAILGTWFYEILVSPLPDGADTFLVAGYCKIAISFVKYCPQVNLNYKRQSTVGWSLANVLLDLTGGLLSFAQIFLEAAALN